MNLGTRNPGTPESVTIAIAIALGSNLGDRREHLNWAIEQLRDFLNNLRVSSIIETDPVGVPDAQPPYLNAVAVGETTLEPEALLQRLLALERARGRERPARNAARTLDLDVILYGDRIVHADELEVPHPRFRDRAFVLEPLSEVAPHLKDPVSGLTVAELLTRQKAEGTRQKEDGR